MYKFKVKFLYNGDECFYTKTKLTNFRLTLSLVKLVKISARLVPNGLIFSDDTLFDVQ